MVKDNKHLSRFLQSTDKVVIKVSPKLGSNPYRNNIITIETGLGVHKFVITSKGKNAIHGIAVAGDIPSSVKIKNLPMRSHGGQDNVTFSMQTFGRRTCDARIIFFIQTAIPGKFSFLMSEKI